MAASAMEKGRQELRDQEQYVRDHGGSELGYVQHYAGSCPAEQAREIFKADRQRLAELRTAFGR